MSTDFIIQLAQFIAGLAILIVLHELGHFLAARLLKVDVEEFGIGFPPRLLTLFHAWGTRFSVNWIPLGGFVRIKGENDPTVEGGMAAANPWVRLGILFAGPMMNIAIGVMLAIIIIYTLGVPTMERIQIIEVVPGSPAAMAGLLAGDEILKINDQEIKHADQFKELITSNLGKSIQVSYLRGDQTGVVNMVPRSNPPPNQGAIGIAYNPIGYGGTQPTTWTKAISEGLTTSKDVVVGTLSMPLRMIRGEASPQEGRVVGYKGMFDIFRNLRAPLTFFMFVSLSLGIINLLPIPALDGGRILFTLPEIIIKRKVPPQYENAIHLVGFAMLIILLIYINLQDFINPLQLPK
jgi:regulator of sigma E protease